MWREVSWHLSRRKCRRNFCSHSQSLHRISREGKKEVMNKIGSRFDNEKINQELLRKLLKQALRFYLIQNMQQLMLKLCGLMRKL